MQALKWMFFPHPKDRKHLGYTHATLSLIIGYTINTAFLLTYNHYFGPANDKEVFFLKVVI